MATAAYSEHEGRKRHDPVKYGEIRSLYPRSSQSATRTARRWSVRTGKATFEESLVIGFKNVQAGVEQLALGDDDDVESPGDLVATENLSNQSFSSVSLHGAAQLLGSGD